jgi:hypothetical protein
VKKLWDKFQLLHISSLSVHKLVRLEEVLSLLLDLDLEQVSRVSVFTMVPKKSALQLKSFLTEFSPVQLVLLWSILPICKSQLMALTMTVPPMDLVLTFN